MRAEKERIEPNLRNPARDEMSILPCCHAAIVIAGSTRDRANERANLCQGAASVSQLRIEQMPRIDHVRPHRQCYPDTSSRCHTGESDRVVQQRLGGADLISMGGSPRKSV